jgi:hypothetical protein
VEQEGDESVNLCLSTASPRAHYSCSSTSVLPLSSSSSISPHPMRQRDEGGQGRGEREERDGSERASPSAKRYCRHAHRAVAWKEE